MSESGPIPTSAVTGVLLCGGLSRRMGSDKALALLAGRPLLEHALAALDAVAERTLLATGTHERYAEYGRPIVLDSESDAGPLAGLAAGLRATETAWIACLPCDAPRVDGQVLRALLARAHAEDLDVAVLASERGAEPTIGVVHRRVLPAVEASLASGDRRLISYWTQRVDGRPLVTSALGPAELGLPELESHEPARNLNTPAELEAERRVRAQKVIA